VRDHQQISRRNIRRDDRHQPVAVELRRESETFFNLFGIARHANTLSQNEKRPTLRRGAHKKRT
jgi:hypothetical protein